MGKDFKVQVVDNYVEAYNNFDVEAMTKNFDENIVFKNTENGIIILTTNGVGEFKEVANKSKDFFTQRNISILEYDVSDDFVIIYINFKAILAQDLNENLKAGDEFNIGGKSVFYFKDGKITTLEDYS